MSFQYFSGEVRGLRGPGLTAEQQDDLDAAVALTAAVATKASSDALTAEAATRLENDQNILDFAEAEVVAREAAITGLNDAKLGRNGVQAMTGSLLMGGNTIQNLADPNSPDDAANAGWVATAVTNMGDAKLSLIGGMMLGPFSMGGYEIQGVGSPNSPDDAANAGWVETAVTNMGDAKLSLIGGMMLGPFSMGGYEIQGVGSPNSPDDAANAGWVEESISTERQFWQGSDKTLGDIVSRWVDISGTLANGYYHATTGAFVANAGYRSFKVVVGPTIPSRFRASGYVAGAVVALAVYFNSGGGVIGSQFVNSGIIHDEQLLTIPDGTVSIAVTGSVGYPVTLEQTVPISSADLDERLTTLEAENYYQGKKVCISGTSIPAGLPDNNYPAMAAALAGVTMVNEALPSSMMRIGYPPNIAPDDPFGWTGMTWGSVFLSLSATLAEKEELIANYGSKWRDRFIGPDKPAAPLSSDWQSVIRGSSWENRIAPNLGSNRPALWLFDHGYNDRLYFFHPDTTPIDTRDRTTFFGAFNYIMDIILADNPKQRIAIIGHYENKLEPDYITAIEMLAEFWSIPILRTWQKLGWSQQEVMVGGVATTLLDVWAPDGVHPHSDTTGSANAEIARHVATFIQQGC